jgi:glycine/D-amino acid oxidase-like deaminating enzyme
VNGESASVVIVGGGAMGTSAACHLAELGVTDVVLCERGTLGSGSTSKAAGGIRAQFADELNIRIALLSLVEFRNFEERFGVNIDFRQTGYLFLLDSDEDVARFREAVALQGSLGVLSTELTLDEVVELVPQLQTEGLRGATFCPRDGHATPEAVVRGYAAAAAEKGVRIQQGVEVKRILVLGNKILGVETTAGRIKTDVVLCTAGVWSREVAALVGVDLPVVGEPRWMHYTPESGGLPDNLPLTVDFASGFYFHREGPGLVFGGREPTIEGVATHATRRLPILTDLPIQSSWWGYYEMSPDHNALVGEAVAPTRFLYATGFSGHGFQQAPAVGEYLAERIVGIIPTLNLAAFSAERFTRGEPREEAFVI